MAITMMMGLKMGWLRIVAAERARLKKMRSGRTRRQNLIKRFSAVNL